jgi:pilus assembly protein CpaE
VTVLITAGDSDEAIGANTPGDVGAVRTVIAARRLLDVRPDEDLVVVGPDIALADACELAAQQRVSRPSLGVVLVRRRVDATVLTDALRAGVREVVRLDDLAALQDSCARSLEVSGLVRETAGHAALAATGERRDGKVFTVFSSKGGCGKTTVASNLAVSLTMAGKKTCLIDLDLAGGDVCIALQLEPQCTLADAYAIAGNLDESAVEALVTTHASGLDVVAAPVDPSDAERIPPTLVTSLISVMRGMYDVIVIDTPPAFSDFVLAAFDESDVNLLLATMDVPALKNLRVTLETMRMLDCPPQRCRVVLNRADANVGLTLADVERALGVPVDVQIPSSRDVPASINRGQPIALDLPKHPVSVVLRQLALTLVGSQAVVPQPRRRLSLRNHGKQVTA